jgi:hypothetical protein
VICIPKEFAVVQFLKIAIVASLVLVACVARGDENGKPEEAEKLLAEFRKIYHLEEGQVIKRIKPPFPKGRMYDLDQRAPEFKVLSNGTYREANLQCLVYRERDGKHEKEWPFFAYTTHGAAKGYEAGSLVSVVSDVEYRDIDDPGRLLLGKLVVGDYVVDAAAPPDKVVAALGQLLKRECGLPVQLELREGEDRIVVVRGRFKPPFVPKLDTPVELYAATLQPGKGEKDQGTFQEFLDDIGRFIEPNHRVINAVEDARQDKISWHRNVRTRFDDKTLHADRDALQVLEHLEEQTGLTFQMEQRKFRKIIVTRSE